MPFGFGRRTGTEREEPQSPAGAEAPPPDDDEHAPGWDALAAHLETAFPAQPDRHWATGSVIPAQDGPTGISAYRDDDAWCYVTFGLSDLFELFESEGPDEDGVTWSGFGLELTMRVVDDAADPPVWPVVLLDQLGKLVYAHGTVFAHGHRLDAGKPITGGTPPTRLTAVAFAADPALPPLDGPLGRIEFVTVVGITADELARAKAATTDDVLRERRAAHPRLATDIER